MKYTIGIPAYKVTFLKECIQSILDQTCRDFEVVVVNDASPEDIDSVVKSFNTQRIRYYTNEKNFGAENVVDNWNKCLSYAKGDFFILMGDDDKMAPDYLEEFDSLIEKYPKCGVYHCRTVIIDENSNAVQLTDPRPEFESVYDTILQRIEEKRLFFISDYVYRTSTLRANNGFFKLPLAWGSDDISCYIAATKNGIAHTNKPVFMYRRNSQTISTGGNIYLKMDGALAEEKWLLEFVETEPENTSDKILRQSIMRIIRLYSQKKKIRTIYASEQLHPLSLIAKWFKRRKQYGLSIDELMYAALMRIKESRKGKYEQ
ncbi:glycosyltransferase family 2 protein [Mucilaginibacter glaciei]|uniref:Glycosyltransferase family 2 protein n=1 Tax=Mucilaginibacter glaciei TaxID=2772109 RepID=A0A926S379_9SPHI|nr:glycosyltransferase family 2 protein [Mucilaginibacter glaciei]MBD1394647.1 glycosyltransferase family 2 protein [Mucilaginibacter glaciei]